MLIQFIVLLSHAFFNEKSIQTMVLDLKKIEINGKNLTLTIGPGSGAFYSTNEKDIVYLLTDRGPNIPHDQTKDILGLDLKGKKGKVFPVPDFTPSIYKIRLSQNTHQILKVIEIKNEEGKKITGLTNPNTEEGFDVTGKTLPNDPQGLDTESIVVLKNGNFYVSDEYLPSIVHINSDGRILKRLKPGIELPAILKKRKVNRGIEAMALSPDEKFIYFSMQSPLAHPNQSVLEHARALRIFRLNIKTQKVDRQYAYLLDHVKSFLDDHTNDQQEVKVSEMAMVDQNHILVLERVEKTTKLYSIDISSDNSNLESKWNDEKTTPTLEELDEEGFKNENIFYLSKKLVLDSSNVSPKLPAKLEGMTYLGNYEWLLINDNDFGITGEVTQLIRIKLPVGE